VRLAQLLAERSPSLLNEARGLANSMARTWRRRSSTRTCRCATCRRSSTTCLARSPSSASWIVWRGRRKRRIRLRPRPLLRRSPLPDVNPRPFLVQAARSDPASTNPAFSALVRAGDFADRVAFYRHDLNFGNDGVPQGSHQFVTQIGAPPAHSRVARGALEQIATFFESDGKTVLLPTPAELWEMPIKKRPEDTFLVPRPR
jgi:hypothetical protein